MGKKLSTAEAKDKLTKINPKVRILGEYRGSSSSLQCKCLKCREEWATTWDSLRNGHGCPHCHPNAKLTTKAFRVRLARVKPDIKPLGEFVSTFSPIKVKCRSCSYTWFSTWYVLKQASRGRGCPRCAHNQKLTTTEVKKRVAKLSRTIKVVGKYTGSFHPLKCKCRVCGTVWSPTWATLRAGRGCPTCSLSLSKFEAEVRRLIESMTGLTFPRAKPSEVPWLRGLHLDGFNKRSLRAFEADGDQHRRSVLWWDRGDEDKLRERVRRDRRKNSQCLRHGVKLVRIAYRTKGLARYIRSKLEKLGWLKNSFTPRVIL